MVSDGNLFHVVLSDVKDLSGIEEIVDTLCEAFSVEADKARRALEETPVVIFDRISKGEVEAIKGDLISLSRLGLDFKITKKLTSDLPRVGWKLNLADGEDSTVNRSEEPAPPYAGPVPATGETAGPAGVCRKVEEQGLDSGFTFSCPCCGEVFSIVPRGRKGVAPAQSPGAVRAEAAPGGVEPLSPNQREAASGRTGAGGLPPEGQRPANAAGVLEAIPAQETSQSGLDADDSIDDFDFMDDSSVKLAAVEASQGADSGEIEDLDEDEALREIEEMELEEGLEEISGGAVETVRSDSSVEDLDAADSGLDDIDDIDLESAVEEIEREVSGELEEVTGASGDLESAEEIEFEEVEEIEELDDRAGDLDEALESDAGIEEVEEIEDLDPGRDKTPSPSVGQATAQEVEDLEDELADSDLTDIEEIEESDLMEVEAIGEESDLTEIQEIPAGSEIRDLPEESVEIEGIDEIEDLESVGEIEEIEDLESVGELDSVEAPGPPARSKPGKGGVAKRETTVLEDELQPWTGRARDYRTDTGKFSKDKKKEATRKTERKETSKTEPKKALEDVIEVSDDDILDDFEPVEPAKPGKPVAKPDKKEARPGRKEQQEEPAGEEEAEEGEGEYSVFLQKIAAKDKKKKAAQLLAEVKEIDVDEAEDLVERMIIPVVRGVSKKAADRILARFSEHGLKGRVTKKK